MSETELRLERFIAAPPERVFALWTEPELLVKWWGPEGYDIPVHALDVRAGGAWRTTMRAPSGKLSVVSGVYRLIEPPRRLVFTWAWEDEKGARGHETEVTVTFAPAPGGTKLTLVQKEFATAESRHLHEQGWSSTFNCLEKLAGQSQR
jgi:uncharacterized protein YndB with AHSA1/START domain